jgi:hypothetical protein
VYHAGRNRGRAVTVYVIANVYMDCMQMGKARVWGVFSMDARAARVGVQVVLSQLRRRPGNAMREQTPNPKGVGQQMLHCQPHKLLKERRRVLDVCREHLCVSV